MSYRFKLINGYGTKNWSNVNIISKFSVKYPCNKCEYEATQKSSLKNHIQSKHEGVWYDCNQCDYKAKQLGILTTHVKLKHSGITTSMLNQQSIEINNQLTSTSTGE